MTKCWEWERSTDTNGYGRTMVNGKTISAHRMSWILFKGGQFRGRHVLHKCDNRRCFNPAHLFLGTHADNMRDMGQKGRASKPLAKLTASNVESIRDALCFGVDTKALALQYKVDRSQIYRIKNSNTWKNYKAKRSKR